MDILLIEQDRTFLASIRSLLSKIPEGRLRHSSSIQETFAESEGAPDVVLIADGLSGEDSLQQVAEIHSRHPDAYLIVSLSTPDESLVAKYRAAGAGICILKDEHYPSNLDRAVKKAMVDLFERKYQQPATDPENYRIFEDPASTPTRTLSTNSELSFRLPGFESGTLFAQRYLIEELLGEGGMGIVYKATDTVLKIPVALKILSHFVQSDKYVERFKREVILARKVAHKGVCRIYDFGQSGGIQYVSMEFLDGRTLWDILEDGPLSIESALPILKQVLTALQELHSVGIIHRDLKPQNVMIDSKGRSCIMDFGISTSSDSDKLTGTGTLLGTPHYMAPEQFEGEGPDHRVDVYAMGIILYQTLTGKLPFEGNVPAAVMHAHLKASPKKPSEIVPSIPRRIEDIILKAIEKNPSKRYQKIQTFLQALEDFESGAHKIESKRKVRYLTAALLVVLAGFGFFWMNQSFKDSPAVISPPVKTVINTKPQAPAIPVSIVALPWARFTIKPAAEETSLPSIPAEERVTPAFLLLPPGDYIVELENGTASPRLEDIQVETGAPNSFVFPMPQYDLEALVAQAERNLE